MNAALATALLAVVAAGDAPRLAGPDPGGNAEAAAPAPQERDDAEGAGEPTQPPEDEGSPGPGASPNSLPPQQDPDEELAKSIPPLLTSSEARLSVAVLAEESGLTASYGEGSFDTASIVKVDILAALLLQAQDEGRELTASERALAEMMIQFSDNSAAESLWWAIGGEAGLDAANERLGLTQTTGGSEGLWGLTQTTSEDQIALLRAVFSEDGEDGEDSVLEPSSRAYIQELMGSVAVDQQWGISAASEGEFELKNGWLPRSQTGLWDINSIGRVTVDGDSYLVAVVSDGHVSMAGGVTAVEAAARAAVDAVRAGQ
jgi:hypothetical protein